MNHDTAVVVLAAGAASRYKGERHKLAELLGGMSVLARTITQAQASGFPVVAVTTPVLLPEVADLLPARDIVLVPEAGPRRGMGDSIASGVTGRASASGWLILPGDMPLVRPDTLRAVSDALEQQPVAFAQYRGRRGHPVGFGAELFSDLVRLQGDEGARRLLARYPTAAVEVDDPGVLMDIDTVADLDAARQRLGVPAGVSTF